MDDCIATTLRVVRAQTDSRPIALRSKSRRKEFWTVKNSSATSSDRMATTATDHNYTATVLGPYCDLPRFGPKTGRSTVAAAVWLGYYRITANLGLCHLYREYDFDIVHFRSVKCGLWIFWLKQSVIWTIIMLLINWSNLKLSPLDLFQLAFSWRS